MEGIPYKKISTCSFAAWNLSAWSFTNVVEKNPPSTGSLHPKMRRNTQENCVVILPMTDAICCALALDLYVLLRRLRQTELPGGRAKEGALSFYLTLLKWKHHLTGEMFQQQHHLAGKGALDSVSYTDPFYFCSALISCSVLSLFQKSYVSSFFNEKWYFLILKDFWSSLGSSL